MVTNLNITILSSFLNDQGHDLEERESLKLLSSLFNTSIIPAEKTGYSDSMAVFIASGGSEEKFMQIIDGLPKPIIIISDSYNNSLPAALEICSRLERDNIIFEHINIPLVINDKQIKFLQEELSQVLIIQNALIRLTKYRIALIGGESPWLISSDIEKHNIEEKYGVSFISFDTDVIADEFHKTDCDDKESNHLIMKIKESKVSCLDDKSICEAVKLYNVLKNLAISYSLNALTVKCFDFLYSCKTTACLALAILNDRGITCGCEGDIPALWSMILSREVCRSVSFMANPSSLEKESGCIDFAHCTIPLSMGNRTFFTTHYESNSGVGIKSFVHEGEYTIFKNGSRNLDRFYCYNGKILKNTNIKERCRTQVRFKFENIEEIDDYLSQHIGNHTILIPGNHHKILTKYAKYITKI
jgi:L-fucose isomerase-like protein